MSLMDYTNRYIHFHPFATLQVWPDWGREWGKQLGRQIWKFAKHPTKNKLICLHENEVVPSHRSRAAQVASASYMLLIFPPKVPHWTRILIVIFYCGGASVCESQQSTFRKRQCSPVFTAPCKTLDPSITGLKVSSHGHWSRKCGLCGTTNNLLWVFTHTFCLKKVSCCFNLLAGDRNPHRTPWVQQLWQSRHCQLRPGPQSWKQSPVTR